eukprot:TRINITY_DN11700_c0_g3_i4.p1 TRINITY_DN11700_c0_g3~~TRINITY_DN11700_c0_g3_i4.p1  ORF type:complete len:377 (+),score=81.74 TRINITY_DN11700_c0_g3_i4:179-1309(+)
MKIGTLLALGFGDAGSNIIAENMRRNGDIDPMLPGERKLAIFGFCDIRNFTDATEVLQEDVMVFVNTIADIVHTSVDRFAGAANKNIGDAFLLTWKFPDEEIKKLDYQTLVLHESKVAQGICDFSLISFLKIIAKVHKSRKLEKYRMNTKLNERLPNYQVRMGFGLHLGWAIEGAIGSQFKIDASYLSPNVNMASRLEAATKQYGVQILISGELRKHFSEEVGNKCRRIDYVTVKGSKEPVEFYTVDYETRNLRCSPTRQRTFEDILERQRMKKEQVTYRLRGDDVRAWDFLETDKDLRTMLECHQDDRFQKFKNIFEEGFAAYTHGDWLTAKGKLENALSMHPEDGPSKALYSVLKERNFSCPPSWRGYRILTEK